MRDIALEIRMELLRARPDLTAAQANGIIADVAHCYFRIQKDNAACRVSRWEDFYELIMLGGVALVPIYRKEILEILVFTADDSLIRESEHIAMCEVEEFLRFARGHFRVPDVGLQISMSNALPWMEKIEAEDNATV